MITRRQRLATSLRILKAAVGVYLRKEDRRHRLWLDYHKAYLEHIPNFRKAAMEYLAEIRASVWYKLDKAKTVNDIKDIDKAIDWTSIKEEGVKIFSKPMLEGVVAGQDLTQRQFKKYDRTDPIGVSAVNYAAEHSAELIVEITDETRAAVNDLMKAGVAQGLTVPQLAAQVRPLVGLTDRMTGWVDNYGKRLLEEGLSPAQTAKRLDKYINKLLRYRSEMIARTETAFALTEGQIQGYAAGGAKYLERVEDPDCCEICFKNNHRSYTIKSASGVLPAHPNCEGTWVYTDVPPGKEKEWPPKGEWKKPIPKPKRKPPTKKPRGPAGAKKPKADFWGDWEKKFKDLGLEKVVLQGCDRSLLKPIYDQLKLLMKKYPGNRMNALVFKPLSGKIYGQVSFARYMELNTKYHGDPARLLAALKSDAAHGWHPTGIPDDKQLVSVLTHEFGHTVWNKSNYYGASNPVLTDFSKLKGQISRERGKVWKDHYQNNVPLEVTQKKSANWEISDYSKKNINEYFAEGFAGGELSDTPSEAMRLVVDYAKKHFGEK